MKRLTLIALAGAVMLGGCSTAYREGSLSAEQSYTPVGTLIPRKGPSRLDNVTILNKQALENDRTMGGANRDGVAK